MAKKLCELCGKNLEADMRFGVRLCQECLDGYNKAMSGDTDAVARFLCLQNFPNAADLAQKQIIQVIAKRNERMEAVKQEQQKIQQQQQVAKERDQKRAEHARSIGIEYQQTVTQKTEAAVDTLYTDIGKKIKKWAKWIFYIEAIAAAISALVMLFTAENGWEIPVALLMLVAGPLIAWVSSWILYAFGELVEKTSANEQNTRNILKLMLENNAQKDKD